MNALTLRREDLDNIPFSVQAQLAELPQEAQRDFIMEYHRRKKELPIAYLAHFVSLSEGYLDNWTLQIFFWLSYAVGIGPFWWFINLFRMPGKVKRYNQNMAGKVLKYIHYKYQISGKGMVQSLKRGRIFEPPSTLLARQSQNTQIKPRPWKPTDGMGVDALNQGAIFDHNLETWEVVNEGQYDWEDNTSEKILKVQQIADVKHFVLLLKKEFGYVSIAKMQPVNIYAINQGLELEISERKRPFNVLTYQGVSYFREYTATGWAFNLAEKQPIATEVVAWVYYDESRQHVMRIETHGKQNFKAFVGKVALPSEFTDVAPRGK